MMTTMASWRFVTLISRRRSLRAWLRETNIGLRTHVGPQRLTLLTIDTQMDIMDLKYPDAEFDVALDKGTLDAIMCEKGDVWQVSEELATNVDKILSEVSRYVDAQV